MNNRKSRKNKSESPFFLKLPFLVFMALVANVFVIYRFETTRKPQVVYSVERVFVNTNVNSQVSATQAKIDSIVKSSKPDFSSVSVRPATNDIVRVVTPYRYFIFQGRRCAEIWQRPYSEGSFCSYGRIRYIFPDRILLADNSYIVNAVFSSSSSLQNPERKL